VGTLNPKITPYSIDQFLNLQNSKFLGAVIHDQKKLSSGWTLFYSRTFTNIFRHSTDNKMFTLQMVSDKVAFSQKPSRPL
jgi:hypothetical protein